MPSESEGTIGLLEGVSSIDAVLFLSLAGRVKYAISASRMKNIACTTENDGSTAVV